MLSPLLSPILAAVLAFVGADPDTAVPDPQPAWLVGFDTLQDRLDGPTLRLIDARPRAEYEKGHIPGAVWVDAHALEKMAAQPGALTDKALWEEWIAPLGLGPETEVLVYDAKRQLDAARLWWLLRYLGAEKVGLIDGNFPLWAAEGRPVTADVPQVAPRSFEVVFQSDRHATKDDVLAAIDSKSSFIVDARSTDEYTGAEKRARRGGHVPAACHLEWNNLVDKDGRFIAEEEARAKLAKIGVEPDQPVITHCQGGGRASVNAFVLERLGFQTRNYYLGWSDWGNAAETPIDSEPGAPPAQ
jgi:thiosulfate/3-mercaptopyruvate sulfurtransferase